MGDMKKLRKKYSTPSHPWQKERIEEEKVFMNEYVLKNKKELWKMSSLLKNYKKRVKELVPRKDAQSELEKEQLMAKVLSLNLVSMDAKIEDVLSITLKQILDRRLQSLVYNKGLAKSMKQARQFVTHEHVFVADKRINSPSYLVSIKEEGTIRISDKMGETVEIPVEEVVVPKKEAKKAAPKPQEKPVGNVKKSKDDKETKDAEVVEEKPSKNKSDEEAK